MNRAHSMVENCADVARRRRWRVSFSSCFFACCLALSGPVVKAQDVEVSARELPISQRSTLPCGTVQVQPPVSTHEQRNASVGRSARHKQNKYDVERIGSRDVGTGINLYSLEREIALGRELAAQTEASVQLLQDSTVADYVNRIAQTLVTHSDARVPFTVKVIDSDEVNAFSLPGGYLYVNSGLLLASDSEAELAGVMAHEIAHVAARHATKTVTRKHLFQLATVPLIFVGGGAATAISSAASFAEPLSFLKFSRNAEREADLLGIEYAYSAGYDPAEFVRFFERLRTSSLTKQQASFMKRLLDTHPMTGDRIRRAQREIMTMLPPKAEYVITTSEFEDIKRRLIRSPSRSYDSATDVPTLRRRTVETPQPQGQGPAPPTPDQ